LVETNFKPNNTEKNEENMESEDMTNKGKFKPLNQFYKLTTNIEPKTFKDSEI
jgi:hypothetical protein